MNCSTHRRPQTCFLSIPRHTWAPGCGPPLSRPGPRSALFRCVATDKPQEPRSPAPSRAGPHTRSLTRPSDSAQPVHRRPARTPERLPIKLQPEDLSRTWGSTQKTPLTEAGWAMVLRGSPRPRQRSLGVSPAARSSPLRPAPPRRPRPGAVHAGSRGHETPPLTAPPAGESSERGA